MLTRYMGISPKSQSYLFSFWSSTVFAGNGADGYVAANRCRLVYSYGLDSRSLDSCCAHPALTERNAPNERAS